MAQQFRLPGSRFTAQQQAQFYYARKRQKARAEATASDGGMREQNAPLGVSVTVTLTTQ
jgi:hypothetical protein